MKDRIQVLVQIDQRIFVRLNLRFCQYLELVIVVCFTGLVIVDHCFCMNGLVVDRL